MTTLNPMLLELAKKGLIPRQSTPRDNELLQQLNKQGFVPAQAAAPGGSPEGASTGGDPTMSGGDPSAMGAAAPSTPPTDPSMGAGAPMGGGSPDMVSMIQQIVQQTLQAQQAQGGASAAGGGGKKKSGGGDEVAHQLYKMNVLVTALITGLQKSGVEIEIPNHLLLGPPPGSDPTTAMGMANQMPGATPTDPNAAAGGDPNAAAADPNAAVAGGAAPQDPSQSMINFMPSVAKQAAQQIAMQVLESTAGIQEEEPAQKIGTPFLLDPKQASTAQPLSVSPNVSDNAFATLELLAAMNRSRKQ